MPFFVRKASELAFDERVDRAVHDALNVTGLDPGPEVFDHLIRLEDIRSNLVPPCDVSLFAVLAFDFGALSILLYLIEFRLQHSHGHVAIASLAPLGLAGNDDAGGNMGDPHRSLNLVYILTAFAAGAESVDLEVGFVDFNRSIFNFGNHIDTCE